MPSSRGQWIWQVGLVSLLLWAGYSYFTASAEARLLADQLEVAMDSVAVVTDALVIERPEVTKKKPQHLCAGNAYTGRCEDGRP